MKLVYLTVFFLILSILSFAQNEDSIMIRKVADEILLHSEAYENLRHLTKKIGPRLSGSPGMVKSEQWGLKMMKEAGADSAYLQQLMVPHWVRGGKDFTMAKWKSAKGISSKLLDVVALGNSVGAGPKGVTADVIEIKSFEHLDSIKEKVRGKIVFYNYKFIDTYINTFQAYSDAGKYRGQGPSRASKYGAVAVIVRSLSNSTDNYPHTGSTRYDSNFAKIPAVAIGLRDADWLSNHLLTHSSQVTIRTHGKFLPDTIGHNVIGELKGSEFPDEIITVGGHLDCWDNCEGAHDDGAGCVQTIEILRAFKATGFHPRRTIRFVLFANEENGLRGGNKYADEAKGKAEKHIFALESDAGAFTPRGFGLSGNDEQYQKFLSWQPLIAPYGCSEFKRGGGGADIGPLNRAFKTVTAGLNPDSQRYFDIHHARNDVFESVNKRELILGAVNMAALIYLVDKYGM